MPVQNAICPGCGAGYNGRRCRRCGYEPFPEAKPHATSAKVPVPRRKRQKHPLIRFLILLLLIWSLLPLLRQWGHQLEAMEDSNIHTNYSTNHG